MTATPLQDVVNLIGGEGTPWVTEREYPLCPYSDLKEPAVNTTASSSLRAPTKVVNQHSPASLQTLLPSGYFPCLLYTVLVKVTDQLYREALGNPSYSAIVVLFPMNHFLFCLAEQTYSPAMFEQTLQKAVLS